MDFGRKIDWDLWPSDWTIGDKLMFCSAVLISVAVGTTLGGFLPGSPINLALIGAVMQIGKINLFLVLLVRPKLLSMPMRVATVIFIVFYQILIEVVVFAVTGSIVFSAPPPPSEILLLPFPAVAWLLIGATLLLDPFALCLIAAIASRRR